MNSKFTLESCLKSAHPQSCQIYKPWRCLSPMLSQKPRGPTKSQILSNEQGTMNMRDFFFLPLPWVCQDSWACLCPTLPLVSRNQQVQTLPKALAFPHPSASRVQSLLRAWLTWEILPVTVDNRGVSQGWRDQRGIFTQRQFSLSCVFNYLTAVVGFGGLGWRDGEGGGQKGVRRIGTKQP